jgi:quinol monooxygenase YgiN
MSFLKTLTIGVLLMSLTASAADAPAAAYLEITLRVAPKNRAAAAEVYKKYKAPFLSKAPGAKSKQLLVRTDDVQVLHGFETLANAEAYLKSPLFNDDVVKALAPLLEAPPEVRVYTAN